MRAGTSATLARRPLRRGVKQVSGEDPAMSAGEPASGDRGEAEDAVEPGEVTKARPRRSVLGSIGTVAGITMLSRVLGLIRDVLMAAAFGLTIYADVFYVAWTLPNLFRRICGEGALSNAFLPVFVRLEETRGADTALALARATLTRLALALAAVVVVAELILLAVPGAALSWLGEAGVDGERLAWICRLAGILLPYLWFICLAGLLSGLLHSKDEFTRPAAIAVVLNLVWIAALVITGALSLGAESRITWLAAALVFGGLLQLLIQTDGAGRLGFPIRPRLAGTEGLDRVWVLFLPMVFGMAIEQLNIVADRFIAWLFVPGQGGVSALYYSMRLVQLPIALLSTAFTTVLFPTLARLSARGESEALARAADRALRITLFATLPAAVGLAVVAPELIALLFQRGAFGAGETARTALCLQLYAPSVVLIALTATRIRAFHAREDTRTPVRVGLLAVGVNLALNLILVQVMGEAGLALATSVAAGVSFLALNHLDGTARTRDLLPALLSAGGLAGIMAAGCLALRAALPVDWPVALRVVPVIAVGVALYAGLARLLRLREGAELIALRRGGLDD